MKTAILCLSLLFGACTFDEDPEFFIDNMRPDLYFALEQPEGAIAASVAFVTKARPGPITMPLNIRVLAWTDEGDNIYNDSLQDTLLDTPTERKGLLQWSGTVAFPIGRLPGDQPSAKWIGVELRTFLPIVAFNGPPQAGQFCEADFMGAGITGCGPWFQVYLNLWAVCRGVVGQLVDCHGLQYSLLPSIYVRGIGKTPGKAMSLPAPEQPEYFLYTSDLYLYRDTDGWRYKALGPADFLPQATSKFADRVAERESFGPFATSEEAARAAVAELGLKPGWWHSNFAAEFPSGHELHGAARALDSLATNAPAQ